jgi:hypothetical protein
LRTARSRVSFITASPWAIIPAIIGASSWGTRSAIQTKRPARLVVYIDDQLARDDPIPEGHDAGSLLQTNIGHKPGREVVMDRPDIPKRVPPDLRARVDQDRSMNRCDGTPSLVRADP